MSGPTFLTATATHAEMGVSQTGEPTASIGGSFTSLVEIGRPGVGTIGEERMASLGDEAGSAAKPVRRPKAQAASAVIRYDSGWLATLPAARGDAQWECLSRALYFEARGETVKGQFAVAEVVLNRVASSRYPSSICGVVNQGGRRGCQFSFTCDHISDRIREQAAWRQAGKIARLMIDGAPRGLTQGATHFHTVNVNPRWARVFPQTAEIGAHLFYRQP